jgi:hypothetical protein
MSLSLVITINALIDTALLGGLAYVMSRATRLTPHVSAKDGAHTVEAPRRAVDRVPVAA